MRYFTYNIDKANWNNPLETFKKNKTGQFSKSRTISYNGNSQRQRRYRGQRDESYGNKRKGWSSRGLIRPLPWFCSCLSWWTLHSKMLRVLRLTDCVLSHYCVSHQKDIIPLSYINTIQGVSLRDIISTYKQELLLILLLISFMILDFRKFSTYKTSEHHTSLTEHGILLYDITFCLSEIITRHSAFFPPY